jgi:DNA invertase Pin-like site-specific DNA recombinase
MEGYFDIRETASGGRWDRPELHTLLNQLRKGDVLVVWKLDRLGRSLPHLLQIVTTLQAQSVAFRSLTEQMDTTTPQGAFLFSVFGALAQYERGLTQERVRAGLAAAQRRGKRGGPRGPFHRPRLSGLAIACTAVVWSRRRRAAVSLEGRRWVWTKARRISPKRAKV